MSSKCSIEKWTMEELSNALLNNKKERKTIVVPIFQRGARWTESQENKFIDSLKKGFPVGTMLFYKRIEENQEVYILVDGLQRGNTIKKYMTNKSKLYLTDEISDEFCKNILEKIHVEISDENIKNVKEKIINYIENNDFSTEIGYVDIIKELLMGMNNEVSNQADVLNVSSDIEKILINFFKEKNNLYDSISKAEIPIVVYEGDEDNLPEIFNRINSKGTALDKYEIYAASWPINEKITIENSEIINHVINKYETLVKYGYKITGYNKNELETLKKVNAFEYLFGLSKYLTNNFDILAFETGKGEDEVNSLAFELVNACLNESNKIKYLYKNIYEIDVNEFEKDLKQSIKFVEDAISEIIYFKRNKRNSKKPLHPKFQILSMIASTYKVLSVRGKGDKKIEEKLKNNLKLYYIYDIITNYWGEGGTSKIHSVSKNNRYFQNITVDAWSTALDSYFEDSMQRCEYKKVSKPKGADYILLNCIYLNKFTAEEQLSNDKKFDVEHIVPKNQIKELIGDTNGDGLPISSIANLCYLPQFENRSKKNNNFYQDKNYLEKVDIREIEEKYSFIRADDLEWMNKNYKKGDFNILKKNYEEFCKKRFYIIKKKVLGYLKISCVENKKIHFEKAENKKTDFKKDCIKIMENKNNIRLFKNGNVYKTKNKEYGFIFSISKEHKVKNKKNYWFSININTMNKINDCLKQKYVFGCGNTSLIVVLDIRNILEQLDYMSTSKDDSGNIRQYHIEYYKDSIGNLKWKLKGNKIIDITDKIIDYIE